MKKTLPLRELAEISTGYPFRTGLSDDPSGTVRVIQMRNITPARVEWEEAVRVSPEENMKSYYLRGGDILFVMRGGRYYATHMQDIPQQAVASMHFFRVRIKHQKDVVPEFLAWQLEQAPAQRYYSSIEAGSAQKSLRLADFAEMPIVLPPLDRQHMLARAVDSLKSGIGTMEAGIANSNSILAAMALKEFEI